MLCTVCALYKYTLSGTCCTGSQLSALQQAKVMTCQVGDALTQSKQNPKFVFLSFQEWATQCECVGKRLNHRVAKTTETTKVCERPNRA